MLMRFGLDIAPLDLDLTLGCGQTFRWRPGERGSWTGVIDDQLVRLSAANGRLAVEVLPGRRDADELVSCYLRADDDIDRIQAVLAKDRVLAPGLKRFRGLRIVKMDEWECLGSYILATYANIPRITKMIEAVSNSFGDRIAGGIHAFPRPDHLARVSASHLRRLGLGYRADYIREVCAYMDEEWLGRMRSASYEDLRKELVALPGVGDKVADCVSLFGFGRLESFPIDVWIERALVRLYGQKGSYSRLRRFAASRFGDCAGYAQEYIYHNERARSGACAFLRK